MEKNDKQVSAEMAFDRVTYGMLLFNDIEGILTLLIDEEAGEASYDTEGFTTLLQSCSGRIPRKEAAEVLKSLLHVWIRMDEYMIPRNELVLGLSNVYIRETDGQICWICGLQKEGSMAVEKLKLFLLELAAVMEGNPEQNQEQLMALLKYVRGVTAENLTQCLEMTEALLLQDIAAESAEAAAAQQEAELFFEEPEEEEKPEPEASFAGLFGHQEEVAYMIRIRTGEEKAILLEETLIGKSADCDFVIGDNRAVSRHHASIIRDEGEYYLVDHHSTNATYLNGMRLDPGDEYRLCHGDGFVLADEPFQFMIR